MLYQVVGSTFGLMESYEHVWKKIRGSVPAESFGFQYEVGLEQVTVDAGRMLRRFRAGLKDLKEIWTAVLGSGDFSELVALSARPDEEFRFPPKLWACVVYDYALAYHKRKLPSEHLLGSLTPLYLGKTASFVMEVRDKSQSEAEAEIEKLCLEFEDGKGYLVNNWK